VAIFADSGKDLTFCPLQVFPFTKVASIAQFSRDPQDLTGKNEGKMAFWQMMGILKHI
jgi:hypothetical protein